MAQQETMVSVCAEASGMSYKHRSPMSRAAARAWLLAYAQQSAGNVNAFPVVHEYVDTAPLTHRLGFLCLLPGTHTASMCFWLAGP